jgi:ABC-2 type transport system permease protein
MKTFGMLVRREYWEHRMLWITPAVIAALLLLAVTSFGVIRAGDLRVDGNFNGGAAPLTADVFGVVTLAMSLPFYLAAAILAVIYLADCLYAERRDRSILFWKSLPVSDRETVLAKLFTGLVLIPGGCLAAAALTSIGASSIIAVRSAFGLVGNVPGWDTGAWLHAMGFELYAIVALVLWYAPYAAYLLLASAWAKRSVYAWAIIPPVLLAVVERTVFGTRHVWGLVRRSFGELFRLSFHLSAEAAHTAGADAQSLPAAAGHGGGHWAGVDPRPLLLSVPLWVGLALAALMVWAAIALRRRAGEA